MANELTVFDYGQLDGDTAAFLEGKASNIRGIVQNAYTDVGRELKEAQERLAGDRYSGVFERWYTSMGWKKQSVYNSEAPEKPEVIDADFTEIIKLKERIT